MEENKRASEPVLIQVKLVSECIVNKGEITRENWSRQVPGERVAAGARACDAKAGPRRVVLRGGKSWGHQWEPAGGRGARAGCHPHIRVPGGARGWGVSWGRSCEAPAGAAHVPAHPFAGVEHPRGLICLQGGDFHWEGGGKRLRALGKGWGPLLSPFFQMGVIWSRGETEAQHVSEHRHSRI